MFYGRMKLNIFLHYILQFLTRSIEEEKRIIRTFILQRGISKNIRILDFGCGEGIFSATFGDANKIKYIGIDRDFNSIKFARELNRSAIFFVNDENICFKIKNFDFILLNNVLHHMTHNEIEILLSEIKRVLKENGVLIVTELAPRDQQKGIFFKIITFFEKKINRINYCCDDFFAGFLKRGFNKIHYSKSGNFVKYILTI